MNNIVDIKLLKEYLNLLEKEKKNFVNKTFNIFNLSYMKNINDEYIKMMNIKLTELYNGIEKNYENICMWFKDYIDNVILLEKELSNNNGKNIIQESSVRNYISTKLPDLNSIKE